MRDDAARGAKDATPGLEEPGAPAGPTSLADLFLCFASVSLQGFGGVQAVVQRVLCDDRRWLTHAQFLELLAIGQVLPGPNVCNLALIFGDRSFGWRGALVALSGLMLAPLAIVLGATALYGRFAFHPAVAGALRGMGAVSAGLIIGSSLRLAGALRRNPMGLPACLGLGGLTFVGVGLWKLPLIWVLLGMGTLAAAIAWWQLGRRAGRQDLR